MASKLKYEINLDDIFDQAYSDKPRQVKAALRSIYSTEDFKMKYGRQVIREIVNRTREKSIDKKDKSFVPYKKSYKESLAFEIAGKTNKVNLTLTGELLASMQTQPLSKKINIVFADQEQNDKAHGHVNGNPDRGLPKRDFFGLPKKDEVRIFKELLNKTSRDNSESNLDITAIVGRQILNV